MSIEQIIENATDKPRFKSLSDFLDFSDRYLEYAATKLQAVIVSQNENHYQFYQYGIDGGYQITRPVNSRLMYSIEEFLKVKSLLPKILKNVKDVSLGEERKIINNAVYTMQMSVGCALDAMTAGKSNTARKLNGDLFERLIRIIFQEIGVDCKSGTVPIPVEYDGGKTFSMQYQHDLIIEREGDIKLIGSIKTSSKDRIDKIFVDKFLFNKLTGKNTPHIAVFLNDVQRKQGTQKDRYGISATFLPGHFCGYTIKLNPLDGVYYCDIRPNMLTEDILKDHIFTFDRLLCEDIWKFL